MCLLQSMYSGRALIFIPNHCIGLVSALGKYVQFTTTRVIEACGKKDGVLLTSYLRLTACDSWWQEDISVSVLYSSCACSLCKHEKNVEKYGQLSWMYDYMIVCTAKIHSSEMVAVDP